MPMRARMVCITRMMRYDEWLAPTARILIHILLPPLNTPTRNRFGPDRNPRRNQRLILCGVPCRELRTRVLLVPIATPHGRPCLRLRTRSRNRRCCRLMRRRHPARGGNCSRARSKPASARKASGKAEQPGQSTSARSVCMYTRSPRPTALSDSADVFRRPQKLRPSEKRF